MATFEFEGKPVTVLAQHTMELGDLAFIKEHFDISGMVELEQGMGEMEPNAWRAILISSIRRTQPDIDPKHPGVDAVAILPLVVDMNAEGVERAEAMAAAAGRARPTSRSRASAGKPR